MAEEIVKAWRIKGGVIVSVVVENSFKFLFSMKKDKDEIYRHRPWSFKVSLLVLKEWLIELAAERVVVNMVTFHVQIYGLPPKLLMVANTKKIGKIVGTMVREFV